MTYPPRGHTSDGPMLLTIITITVIGLALGATLAVWVVHDAISKQPTPVAGSGTPPVMELRDVPGASGGDQAQPSPPSAPGPAQAPAAAGIVFEAAGTNGATNASTIAHTVGWDLRQDAGVALPWRREVQPGATGRLALWVQNAGATGSVTCRIIVDGTTIREETTAVPYGVCRVSASTS